MSSLHFHLANRALLNKWISYPSNLSILMFSAQEKISLKVLNNLTNIYRCFIKGKNSKGAGL